MRIRGRHVRTTFDGANKDIDDVVRWTLRYRYGNKRYFPACCSNILSFQRSSEME